MVKHMHYQVKKIINQKKNIVAKTFVDKKKMRMWEKGFDRIEPIEGKLFRTGSTGYMVFRLGESELLMTVHVLSNQLPNHITLIYEVAGAKNRCINTFRKKGDQTIWTMDVCFEFDVEPQLPIERFIEKTNQGMEVFKDFVETIDEEM
jgi:hypothetical protein